MNYLELNKIEGNPIPVPYYPGGGVQMHLLQFLTRRYYHPTVAGAKSHIKPKTLSDMANNIKFMLNCIGDVELADEHGEVVELGSLNYQNITYDQLKQIVTSLHYDWEYKGQSIKPLVRHLREFYEFLYTQGVPHNMFFEGKRKVGVRKDMDGDFLSHTKGAATSYEYEIEPLVPNEWCDYRDHYRGSVISMAQFAQLWDELEKQDPVYAVMAGTMLQSFLRIGGVMQLPVKPDKNNPSWQRYGQMDKYIGCQEFHYIKKGGSKAKCLIHMETMKMIHEKYILPYRSEREELYIAHYCATKHAKKLKRTVNDSFLWLNKRGKPVSIPELQAAFKKASNILGFRVTPHFMRHTGATQLLYRWGEANETTICEMHKSTIHSFLKNQLGHVDLETTMYYIRTIENLVSERVFVEFMPESLAINDSDTVVEKGAKSAFNRAMEMHRKAMG